LNRSVIVVANKGIDSHNWRNDLDVVKIGQKTTNFCAGCLAHIGFQEAWETVSPYVNQGISLALEAHPTFDIVFVGHSLGGAISDIGATHARANYTNKILKVSESL
jgi:Lipase (class 3)